MKIFQISNIIDFCKNFQSLRLLRSYIYDRNSLDIENYFKSQILYYYSRYIFPNLEYNNLIQCIELF